MDNFFYLSEKKITPMQPALFNLHLTNEFKI